jgi:hypothetical protein
MKLVKLKESADGSETGRKIRSLLTPMEYTRLDDMIDVMFTTATDVEQASQVSEPDGEDEVTSETPKSHAKGTWEFTEASANKSSRR